MTREDFLKEMDDILGLAPGTLRGTEKLEELENWDSTSMISLIALAETNNNAEISPEQIITCTTVEDLVRIANVNNVNA
jgi:acyl carrier protein